MKSTLLFLLTIPMFVSSVQAQLNDDAVAPRAQTENGILEGTMDAGLRVFRGIPFAQPPLGNLRWKAPEPVKNWTGVRKADNFGPRCMQRPFFDDMLFRSDGMSEDCLYLNVWTPARSVDEGLPVLVYFYGGGLFTGDGSEYRYDGASLARQGIVTLTVNYRLNIFGFFAHPELSKEAAYNTSGNYGFLDQTAALQWIKKNIAAFGGDPSRVTIAGESAGSVSVSAQMASPLAKELIAGAIGSSGSLMGTLRAESLSGAEQKGVEFGKMVDTASLAELRAMPAEDVLKATEQVSPVHFTPVVDGHFFPKSPTELFETGQQAMVPLLLGWNSEEMNFRALMAADAPTVANFEAKIKTLYGDDASEVLQVYAPKNEAEVEQVAGDLAGDRFTAFSTWKWADLHSKTNQPVYRYYFAQPRPGATGAVHSAEIEYAMGNLPANEAYDWTVDDHRVSAIFQSYYANFVKTGNPNGLGVPAWPELDRDKPKIMHIDAHTHAVNAPHQERYHVLDKLFMQGR